MEWFDRGSDGIPTESKGGWMGIMVCQCQYTVASKVINEMRAHPSQNRLARKSC